MTTPAQRAAEQQPRRVLTEDQYDAAYQAARHGLGPHAPRVGSIPLADALDAALAVVGILAPPPEPEADLCDAMFADLAGGWRQCAEEPGHDPAQGHGDGEWSWPHGATQARPEPDEGDDAEMHQ